MLQFQSAPRSRRLIQYKQADPKISIGICNPDKQYSDMRKIILPCEICEASAVRSLRTSLLSVNDGMLPGKPEERR